MATASNPRVYKGKCLGKSPKCEQKGKDEPVELHDGCWHDCSHLDKREYKDNEAYCDSHQFCLPCAKQNSCLASDYHGADSDIKRKPKDVRLNKDQPDGLPPHKWLVVGEDENYIYIRPDHNDTDKDKTIRHAIKIN